MFSRNCTRCRGVGSSGFMFCCVRYTGKTTLPSPKSLFSARTYRRSLFYLVGVAFGFCSFLSQVVYRYSLLVVPTPPQVRYIHTIDVAGCSCVEILSFLESLVDYPMCSKNVSTTVLSLSSSRGSADERRPKVGNKRRPFLHQNDSSSSSPPRLLVKLYYSSEKVIGRSILAVVIL